MFKEKLDRYKDYILYERQLAFGTANIYLFHILRFLEFVGKNISEITQDDIRDYVKYLRLKDIKGSTIAIALSSLRSFFEHTANLERTPELTNICFFLRKIIRIKKEKTIVHVPQIHEVEKLRNTISAYKDNLSSKRSPGMYRKLIRDMAVLEMIIATGARSAEIRSMKVSDFDFGNMTVFIKGKGGHQRVSIFSDTARDCVLEHIMISSCSGNDLIFPMGQGNLLNYIIKRWAKRAGINQKLHPHSFRHYHITEMQRLGVNMRAVADQVGHMSLNTTRRYTHLDFSFRWHEYKNHKL